VLVFLCDPNDATLPEDPADALLASKRKKLQTLRDRANQYKHHATFFTSPDRFRRRSF